MNMNTSEIIQRDNLWSLVVTYPCKHVIGYAFALKKAAEKELPEYESQECPYCAHAKWMATNNIKHSKA